MGTRIRSSDLRNDYVEIMRRVAAGETFTVTVHGRPVADIAPHRARPRRRRFVPVADLERVMTDGPQADPAAWPSDVAETDELFGPDEPVDPFDAAGR
ncbi:type II toxin-antitoxin system prevent-host-death family antitoxin [Pseudactinotalea sp. HY160]|uniref:type II toxin-antitoxin system Phd/YefM family antitoxin n=1 Tax=Pseudactinotalea sp. HY160 TaxID=2654490 RepID=UPI00128DB797|nr:type II toxin-antitoxin system prevent-host-death family antitoxin [Pseudactinotalea sp. HY160]MPV51333.1 type II toxin-antitoxin system prevent-host-death family antitoxin [Pseudactinotalea sp. HY160]